MALIIEHIVTRIPPNAFTHFRDVRIGLVLRNQVNEGQVVEQTGAHGQDGSDMLSKVYAKL
jgi:hypothetical protein